jgi:hypothetical protein
MPRFDTPSQHAIEVHVPAQAVLTAVEAVSVNFGWARASKRRRA